MTITDKWLVVEKLNPLGGVQRIYRFSDNYHGLSLINSYIAHSYPFAWEAAVLDKVTKNGEHAGINYTTPLTSAVVVFISDKEANDFIEKAAKLFVPPTTEQSYVH